MSRRARRQIARRAGDLNALEASIADAIAARGSGVALTAFELPIVVACRDLIANTVGQLPMIAYRGNAPRPDQPPIIVRPDPYEPRWQTLHRLCNNLTGWGHAWLVPSAHYADEYPAAVRVVDASRAFGEFDSTGRLTAVYYDGQRLEPGTGAILIPWRVTQAGSLGTAPLADCSRAIEYLAALYDMAGSFWEAGFPSVAVLVKQTLNATQTAELKSQVLSAWARKHEPAIIDRDGQLAPIGSSAVESQLVESIAIANTEIARAFGVMPSLVNVAAGDSLTYATTEAEFSKWLKVGLGQYLNRIEAAFTDLTPYGTQVRFDTAELLRTDLTARYQAYAIGVDHGWILPAEVRAREGFPPLPADALPPPSSSSTMLADPVTDTATPNIQEPGRLAMSAPRQTVARAAGTLEAAAHIGIVRRAQVETSDDAARTISVCLVPWGQVARVTDDGRSFYDESWTSGSLEPDDLVAVFDGHQPTPRGIERGALIGRATGLEDRPDGLFATLELADSGAGRDAYALARTLGAVHVSIEADVPSTPAGDTIVRTADAPSILTGVAICWPPTTGAFAGAVGAARVAASPDPDPDEPDPAGDEPDPDPVARGQVAELVRAEIARFGVTRSNGRPASPLARFGSFSELTDAARRAPRDEAAALNRQFVDAYAAHRAARVWVNQITTDNPGVIPPAWLSEVFGIVDSGRPSITALGGPLSPGENGMDVYWPYYDGDLTTLVGEQVAQKTEITSVLVSFKRGQATLKTYAGGSDVALQLQKRSVPGYLTLYDNILQIAYGLTTENAFVDALVAGAGHTLVLAPLTATAGEIRAFLFGASAHVRTVTGLPASAVLVSSDVFLAWGSREDLMPSQYGTQNQSGTADAASLQISISGLEIVEAPMAPAGTVIVTNEQAARWIEDGPFLISAPDVPKLGTDVAIWGMGAPGLFLPSGVTKAAAVAGRSASKS